MNRLQDHHQILVVIAQDWDCHQGILQRYCRADSQNAWESFCGEIPVVLGTNGLAWGIGLHPSLYSEKPIKIEGDKKSPAGFFSLGPAFGFTPYDEMSHLKIKYLYLNEYIEAIDDPKSHYYNQIVNRKEITNPDWHSSEKMRMHSVYSLGCVINHNFPKPKKDAGSAIFLHLWRSEYCGTAGCTAISHKNLHAILSWLDRDKKPLLIQLPKKTYLQYQEEWGLPFRN